MKKTLYLSLILLFTGLLMACTSTEKPTYSVTIDNQSSHEICSVKFYPSGSYLFHAKLKTKKIAPHQTATINAPEGVYDIRLKTCDGLVWGTDYFKVPDESSWSVNDEQLFAPVR